MGFYLPRLESKVNPDLDLRCNTMKKAYWGGDGVYAYTVMIPRGYTSAKAFPVTGANQMQPEFIDDFRRVVTNTEYIAIMGTDTRAIIDLANDLHIDPFRTYVTGFSQGGHISMSSAWCYPDRFAACVPSSPDLRLPNQAFYFYNVRGLKNVPVRICQGTMDDYIDGTLQVYEVMQEAGCPVEFMQFYGGHAATLFQNPDKFPMISTFFDQHVLNPYPKTVYHVVEGGKSSYTRAFWVDGKLAYIHPGGVETTGFNPWYQISADKITNTISIDSANAVFTAFDFYLNDSLVDMASPVNVVKNGVSLFYSPVPSDGKVSVIIATEYTIPATATTKASVITAQQLSSGVTRNQWQTLDSIRCLVFNDCSDTVPSTATQKAVKPLSNNAGITVNPNPFNPRTSITVNATSNDGLCTVLKIYTITGKIVKDFSSLPLSSRRSVFSVNWDASVQPSGIYIVKAVVGGKVLTRQITLLK